MSYVDRDEVFEPVLRVLRGTLDFRGRARRTDGILYSILVSLIFTVLGFIVGSTLSLDFVVGVVGWLSIAIQLPLIAWFVRRMHDYGLTGWAALPFLAWMAINSRSIAFVGIDPHTLRQYFSFQVANDIVVIAFLGAIFWKPDEGANRFGPNPRFDTAGEPTKEESQSIQR
jgi:uncharacterized membrane protein YhaH (DUF805 family)